MAIVGNSVGGNMSTVTAIRAKEKNDPKIKFQILMWPIVDSNFETKSYKLYGEQRFLTTGLMEKIHKYLEKKHINKAWEGAKKYLQIVKKCNKTSYCLSIS